MNPQDFAQVFPTASVFLKTEHEEVCHRIIQILADTGNKFRVLTWEEYEERRRKDGESVSTIEREKKYFYAVLLYTISAKGASQFCWSWLRIYKKAKTV